MAEEVGFEPTVPVTRDGGFQDRCLKPLDHSSDWTHFQRDAAAVNFDQSIVTSSVIFSRSLRVRRSSETDSVSGTVTSLTSPSVAGRSFSAAGALPMSGKYRDCPPAAESRWRRSRHRHPSV